MQDFDTPELAALYDDFGTVQPVAFDALLEAEGVDIAVVLAEYSPKVTGIQAVEDMLPLAEHNPARIKFAANVNPHLHYPIDDELHRQLSLGAVGYIPKSTPSATMMDALRLVMGGGIYVPPLMLGALRPDGEGAAVAAPEVRAEGRAPEALTEAKGMTKGI